MTPARQAAMAEAAEILRGVKAAEARREARGRRGRRLTEVVLARAGRMRTSAEADTAAARCSKAPGLFRSAGSSAWWSGAVTGWTVCAAFFTVAMVVQALVHNCQAVTP